MNFDMNLALLIDTTLSIHNKYIKFKIFEFNDQSNLR
jgi:hypothetical protein